MKNWKLSAGALLVLGCFGGCVTVVGPSATDMKDELQASFLYRSARAFASASSPNPFDVSERITDGQKQTIRDEYQRIANTILTNSENHRRALEALFPAMKQTALRPRVRMSDSALDAPRIGANGEIFVDVRVARLMYRDAVVTSMKSEALGSVGFMQRPGSECYRDKPDAVLLNCFLAIQRRVDTMRGQSMIGMLFDDKTWDLSSDAPWFVAADIVTSSLDLQGRYYGVMLFVSAHEIAHVLLGHVDPVNRDRYITPDARRDAELAADDLAVTLLTLATQQGVLIGVVDTPSRGFETFFNNTYRNAKWPEDGGESHPSRQERLARAQRLHETIRGKQADELWQVLEAKLQESSRPAQ